MSSFGPCQEPECPHTALVGMNGTFLCLPHFEERLKVSRANLDRLLKLMRSPR
jgi:hypothetical protein